MILVFVLYYISPQHRHIKDNCYTVHRVVIQ